MSQVTEAIRAHHRELLATLTAYVDDVLAGRLERLPDFIAFLTHELLPHAKGEEAHLYPTVEPLVKAHGQATATMSVDHTFIEALIRQIAQAGRSTGTGQPPEQVRLLQRLACQLEGILNVHLEKEEQVYLPLFERYVSEAEQQRVLDGMHAAYEEEEPMAEKEIDVRQIPPRDRHPLIFQTFEALSPGESFVLVNDHDPKPLYYQFSFEREGQFDWEYLEEGPEVWRVRIRKRA